MTQRLAFATAAAMVAFIIVIMGAVGAYVVLNGPARTTAFASVGGSTQQSTTDTTQSTGLPSQEAPQTQGSDQAGYAVTPEQAASIALGSAVGASLVQEPRLVNFRARPLMRCSLTGDSLCGRRERARAV